MASICRMSSPETESARNRRMPRDARRAQVLAVAQDLFSSEGFHHVSMDDIADRAKVSKPVLYRHFPSKLDLYLAVVDDRGAGLLAAVDAALAPLEHEARGAREHDDARGAHAADDDAVARSTNGRAVLERIVRAYVEFVDGAGESSALLFESDVTHDAAVRARVELAGAQAARGIARFLVEFTGLPAPQAALLAATLNGMAQSGATCRMRSHPGLTVEDAADLIARLAWGGVAGLARTPESAKVTP